jgi:hypothetical protein
MTPLQMPLALPLWELASLRANRLQMRELLGESHFVEKDSARTAGGEEDAWAYLLPSGQRMLVIFQVPYRMARLIADPPDLGPVLHALGVSPQAPGLSRLLTPFPLA